MTTPVSITPAETRQFHRDGYLLLPGVFDPAEVSDLLAEVERLVAQADRAGSALHEPYYHAGSFKLVRALRLSERFDPLIDHPGYFGRLVALLGPYLQLMGTELFVRGVAETAITGFHTDLGPAMQQLRPASRGPYLEIKTQVFLTDLSTPDSSNFMLVPGSHRRPAPPSGPLCLIEDMNAAVSAGETPPCDVVQVCCKPGDVLLFPHTLWHGVAANRSGRTRYSISFRYGQLALRPVERFDPILADPARLLTPRQRRLLGDLGDESPSPYRPLQQEAIILGKGDGRA